MRALLELGVVSKEELLQIVTAERDRTSDAEVVELLSHDLHE